ncbi:MAG: hypothetical protein ACD_5C00045G0002 [uncultured bacterium]|nr:MAG: hypothetical protein ACD_5C00045G0002 [uncultured bacterium]
MNYDFGKDCLSLQKELSIAKKKRSFYDLMSKAVPITGVFIFIVMALVYYTFDRSTVTLSIGVFYLAIALIYPLFPVGGIVSAEVEALESELTLRVTGADAVEQRAERLFKSHELGLRRYYNLALRHSSAVFIAGLGCIVFGFVIVGFTLYFIFNNNSFTIQTQVLGAILGSVAGILSSFVSTIFLRMFSETIKSLSLFHDKLVGTNHLHFANFLLSKISDDKQKDKILSELVIEIAKGK